MHKRKHAHTENPSCGNNLVNTPFRFSLLTAFNKLHQIFLPSPLWNLKDFPFLNRKIIPSAADTSGYLQNPWRDRATPVEPSPQVVFVCRAYVPL